MTCSSFPATSTPQGRSALRQNWPTPRFAASTGHFSLPDVGFEPRQACNRHDTDFHLSISSHPGKAGMDELATHADAVHVSTGYSVLPSPPIPTGRQVQGVAGAFALGGAGGGGFGDEVGQVAGGRGCAGGWRVMGVWPSCFGGFEQSGSGVHRVLSKRGAEEARVFGFAGLSLPEHEMARLHWTG